MLFLNFVYYGICCFFLSLTEKLPPCYCCCLRDLWNICFILVVFDLSYTSEFFMEADLSCFVGCLYKNSAILFDRMSLGCFEVIGFLHLDLIYKILGCRSFLEALRMLVRL